MEKKKIRISRGEYYVYVYLDPRKPGVYVYGDYKFLHEPIYVGKGKKKRAYYFERKNGYLRNKLEKIGRPLVLILAKQLIETESFLLEKELITLIGRHNLRTGPLYNLTDGGEGVSGRFCSEKTKRRVSETQKGKVLSEITKNKMSVATKGRIMSEEWKKKISDSRKGQTLSEETKDKISKACTGKPKNRIVAIIPSI